MRGKRKYSERDTDRERERERNKKEKRRNYIFLVQKFAIRNRILYALNRKMLQVFAVGDSILKQDSTRNEHSYKEYLNIKLCTYHKQYTIFTKAPNRCYTTSIRIYYCTVRVMAHMYTISSSPEFFS